MQEKYDLSRFQHDLVKINKRLSLKTTSKYEQLELMKLLYIMMKFLGDNIDEIYEDYHYLIKNTLLLYYGVMHKNKLNLSQSDRCFGINQTINQQLFSIQDLFNSFKDNPKIKELKFSDNLINI